MAEGLSGYTVALFGRLRSLWAWPIVALGIDSNGKAQPLAVNADGSLASSVGAANLATSQATSTGTAATLVVARPTRRGVAITNTDASNSVYLGPATVTAGNGYLLVAGATMVFTFTGIIQIIDDASNHCVVTVADEYG